VHVPDANDEAMRDLCRARTDAVQDLRRGRAQLKAFLLRNGYRYTGKSAWTEAHRRYLRELVLPHPAQRVVLEDAIGAIGSAEERIGRLEDQMQALLESWHMKPGSPVHRPPLFPSASSVVAAMMALRGFALVGAMVLVSELGGAWRFDHPRQLMAYLGLVPTENTSCDTRLLARPPTSLVPSASSQGRITKTGNSHARWLMIEAAHHYRLSPKVSKELSVRQQGQCAEVRACAWKAQTRLHKRMMQLCARGKERNKVTVAVARELCGFVWHIFRIMEPRLSPSHAAHV
jgi:transposase